MNVKQIMQTINSDYADIANTRKAMMLAGENAFKSNQLDTPPCQQSRGIGAGLIRWGALEHSYLVDRLLTYSGQRHPLKRNNEGLDFFFCALETPK